MALIKNDFSKVVEIDKRYTHLMENIQSHRNMHIMNMGTENIGRLERLIASFWFFLENRSDNSYR